MQAGVQVMTFLSFDADYIIFTDRRILLPHINNRIHILDVEIPLQRNVKLSVINSSPEFKVS